MNPPLPDFRAVILDMDGLVLDSESTYSQAWRQAAGDIGFDLSEAFCESLFGRHADAVVEALAEVLGPAFERESFFRAAERYWLNALQTHGMPRMLGVDTLLTLFRRRNIPYALATNSDGLYARQCLNLAGMHEDFPVVVTRDQVALGKPEPDLILEAARRLDTPPAHCLVLEDSETGLLAARAAGTFPILIQRREDLRMRLRDRAGLVLESLLELAQRLENNDMPDPQYRQPCQTVTTIPS
jgi:beta-phosphoglucomutase-like phosphatase (HAD superfamily)